MKQRTFALLVAVMTVGLVLLSSCGDQDKQPTGASAIAAAASPSPSPSPTPPDDDPLSCRQVDLKLAVLNGAGNADIVFDWREWLLAQALAVNAASIQIRTACYLEASNGLTQIVGWNAASNAVCEQAGDLNGFVTWYKCLQPGRLQIVATNGKWKAVWAGVLINSRIGQDGRPFYLPEFLPTGEALGLYSTLVDGVVVHQTRVSRERGVERLF